MSVDPLQLNLDPQAGTIKHLPQLAETLNAWSSEVSSGFDTVEAELHGIAAGVNYIKTGLTGGGSEALDGIDGNNLAGGELAGVFLGTMPANLYFYKLDQTSGAAEAVPGVIAPDLNPGNKRWLLAARLPRVWPGDRAPTSTDDFSNDHVKGDRWLYNGAVYTCVDDTTGAAVWSSGGGGSVPTGTGFRHVTSGSEDAATKLVENGDVHPSAAIAESKFAFSPSIGHAHDGSSSKKVNHADLNNPGTNTHAQIDSAISDSASHIAATAPHSGHATLSGGKVEQDPENATATPTANKIPISDEDGTLDNWVTPDKGTTKFVHYTIDGGGAVIATGAKGFLRFGYTGTIQSWTLIADQSGSIAIDIWKHASGAVPTASDKITSTTGPSLASAQTAFDSTSMDGWTTGVTAGDVFGFYVSSCSTITRVILELKILVS